MDLKDVYDLEYGEKGAIKEAFSELMEDLKNHEWLEDKPHERITSNAITQLRDSTKFARNELDAGLKPIFIDFDDGGNLCEIIMKAIVKVKARAGVFVDFKEYCNIHGGIDFSIGLWGSGKHFLVISEKSPLHPNYKAEK